MSIAASAVACGGCDSGVSTNTKQVDPCVLVTQNDAAALFGGPAVKKPSVRDECLWGFDSPDHVSWSLRVKVRDLATQSEPDIVVTKTEITYEGQPVTAPSISEPLPIGDHGLLHATDQGEVALYWQHGKNLMIHLELMWDRSAKLKATTKIDPMKKLALKVETSLAAGDPQR
jgi:hypothetical protein